MTHYLDRWARDAVSRPSLPLERSVRVEGVRQAHLGPRMEFARIEFLVEPAQEFQVAMELPPRDTSPEQIRFVDSAIFGFLDVVLLAEQRPYTQFKLQVVGAEVDPVSSSLIAFRLAGRDAGRKFLDAITNQSAPPK
jgi:hypothetical protein